MDKRYKLSTVLKSMGRCTIHVCMGEQRNETATRCHLPVMWRLESLDKSRSLSTTKSTSLCNNTDFATKCNRECFNSDPAVDHLSKFSHVDKTDSLEIVPATCLLHKCVYFEIEQSIYIEVDTDNVILD